MIDARDETDYRALRKKMSFLLRVDKIDNVGKAVKRDENKAATFCR